MKRIYTSPYCDWRGTFWSISHVFNAVLWQLCCTCWECFLFFYSTTYWAKSTHIPCLFVVDVSLCPISTTVVICGRLKSHGPVCHVPVFVYAPFLLHILPHAFNLSHVHRQSHRFALIRCYKAAIKKSERICIPDWRWRWGCSSWRLRRCFMWLKVGLSRDFCLGRPVGICLSILQRLVCSFGAEQLRFLNMDECLTVKGSSLWTMVHTVSLPQEYLPIHWCKVVKNNYVVSHLVSNIIVRHDVINVENHDIWLQLELLA